MVTATQDPSRLQVLAPQPFWEETFRIWAAGGWAMWVLAAIALFMFGLGVHLWLRLRSKGFMSVDEMTWREWIDHPDEREGPIGNLLDFATGSHSLEDTGVAFDQLRVTETEPFVRDLRVMKVCVSAAPLVGLLGTVTGMLATFGAIATGTGGDQTMGLIAAGISEALYTTETGLVIALPGLFFQYRLARLIETYRAFLAQLESACMLLQHRRLRLFTDGGARGVAREQVANRLREALAAAAS